MASTPNVAAPPSLPTLLQTANARLFLMIGAAAAVVALMAAIWFWGQKPEYRVLFANYSDRDGGAIVAALQQLNVPYQYAEGGGAILVPAANVHDARLKLAAQGLPKGGNVGFELMENQKLGISQFLEQVNFQRALEGELARTIEAVAGVQAARVHLALPKASVFLRDQQKPTASVLLNLHPGRALDAQQVSAIVHLVASSVPELPTSQVTVVDQSGNLLSDTTKPKSAGQLDASQLKYVHELQQSIVRRIESIISPIVGAANVRAEATADIDFSTIEQAAETYRPNQTADAAAIRSQSSSESKNNGGNTPSGVPGALSNQPPAPATAPLTTPEVPATTAPGAAVTSTQKDSTINYEVDKTVRYTQQAMGGIKRLSVAVVVNHKQETDKTGKSVTRALTEAEKTAITDLVKEAMGYNQDRGDTLNVVNSPFAGIEKQNIEDVPFYKQRDNIELARESGKYLLMAALIAWLYFKHLKPILRKLSGQAEPETPASLTSPPMQIEPVLGAPAPGGPGYQNDLDNVRQIARDDPKVVANVVKSWVGAHE